MRPPLASPSEPTEAHVEVPALGPVLEFMRAVWALDHALQTTSKKMKSLYGITAPQRLVLRILGRFPGMRAGQLATILHLHPSTVTGVLKRLQRQKLITRLEDPRDRRRAVLGLTARGRALAVDATGTVETAVQSAIETLPEAKVAHAVEVLNHLSAQLAAGVH